MNVPPGDERLRPLGAGDLQRLAEIEREAFPRPWSVESLRTEIERPPSDGSTPASRIDGIPRRLALGVERRGVLLGFVLAWVLEVEVHIARIAVTMDARRGGIARRLMARVLEVGRELGAQHVVLEVREDNDAALGLYEKLGFETCGVRRNYYSEGPDRHDARVLVTHLGDGDGAGRGPGF